MAAAVVLGTGTAGLIFGVAGAVMRAASDVLEKPPPRAAPALIVTPSPQAPAITPRETVTAAPRTITIAPHATATAPVADQPAPAQLPVIEPAIAPATATTVPAPTLPVPTTVPAPAPRSPVQREHTVEKGDTLYSIARRNNTSVDSLIAANGLASRDAVLSIGRKLSIP